MRPNWYMSIPLIFDTTATAARRRQVDVRVYCEAPACAVQTLLDDRRAQTVPAVDEEAREGQVEGDSDRREDTNRQSMSVTRSKVLPSTSEVGRRTEEEIDPRRY